MKNMLNFFQIDTDSFC